MNKEMFDFGMMGKKAENYHSLWQDVFSWGKCIINRLIPLSSKFSPNHGPRHVLELIYKLMCMGYF